jgi:hypothetical protein
MNGFILKLGIKNHLIGNNQYIKYIYFPDEFGNVSGNKDNKRLDNCF